MSNATQGGGGQSAYRSSIANLTGQNSATGIEPVVEVTYTSAEEGAGGSVITTNITGSQNLFLNNVDFQTGENDTDPLASGRTFIMYPPDENITVKITMGASAGESFNGNDGGRGGVTVFTYTLQKNTEYVFKLGTTVSPPTSLGKGGAGAFFYEKGRLLVACGGGGASGYYGGTGGNGGGAGVAGSSGGGSSGGDGGQSVSAGQLPAEGEVPTGGTGGKVESCTSGDYWQSQGVDPCNDVGNVKFRTFDGTVVSSSATIQRGYKGDGGPENGLI